MTTIETTVPSEADVEAPADDDAHHHPGDLLYIQIAIILAAITAVEVLTYFVDFGAFQTPALLIMMVVKFVLIAGYFMHLKFDSSLIRRTFIFGLLIAMFVYTVALSAMNIWTDNGNPWFDAPPPAITTTTVAEGG